MPSALPAAPFIALILLLLTVPHHWRMRSFPTLAIIVWLSLHNLIEGVSAAVWDGNVDPRGLPAKVYCDITTKLLLGAEVGLPGCCLCLARRLYRIVSGYGELSGAERCLYDRVIDIWLCWGMPILVMALHIIVQGHRFDLIEDIGCQPAIYFSWPSLLILNLTVFLSGILSPVYSACTFYKLYTRHRTVRVRIQYHSNSAGSKYAMTFESFVRLVIITFLIGTLTTAFVAYVAYSAFSEEGLQPWTSWADVHDGFGNIWQYHLVDFEHEDLVELYLFWWLWPAGSAVFFVFFGLSAEARAEWRELFGRLGLTRQRSATVTFSVDSFKFDSASDAEKGTAWSAVMDVKHESLPPTPPPKPPKPKPAVKPLEVLVTVSVEAPVIRLLPVRPLPRPPPRVAGE
ncbi:Fungal pheromone STE3G-protein-coupled receptor [Mycena indigotica]|uniref:Fungal pheromone STE3G-protein-coupled receptor n=1 Tax=Mycena indigotica TaxID=2126181 RepID=A0A8H6W759_9AGAR|nr:Fungal pheromone STE3G-protein-coupled receptor [Mycena indigotica]KAF7304158.1 Fungal pheromone STE3G-protein-coupled receptor [Mycena indigotica]